MGLDVGALAAQVLEDMVRGDRAIRRMRFLPLMRRAAPPNVLVATQMRAKLQLSAVRTETKEIVFGIFGEHTRTDVIANVRLTFEVRPVPGSEPPGKLPERFLLEIPPFMRLGDGRIKFVLGGGRRIVARLANKKVRWRDEDGNRIRVDDGWPAGRLVSFLERVSRWLRNAERGEARRFDLSAQGGLGMLLRRIREHYAIVSDRLEKLNQSRIVRLTRRRSFADHPALDAGYILAGIRSEALVQLDRNGNLVSESGDTDPEDWQQIDFELHQLSRAEGANLLISFRAPDFLVSGQYHDRFLQAMREPAACEILLRAQTSVPDPEEFQAFLSAPEQKRSAIFVRLDAEDHDLVLLRGEVDDMSIEYLFIARFEVTPFPEVQPKLVEAQLLSSRLEGRSWDPQHIPDRLEARRRVSGYMNRFVRTLNQWNSGLGGTA
jgi:hypothetical protein